MAEPFRDPTQPLSVRTADLLSRLTLREKVGQLNQRMLGWTAWRRTPSGPVTTAALTDEIARWGGIGALYGLLRADAWSGRDLTTGADPQLSREVTAAVQEQVITGSRLGLPALFVEEAPHGHQAIGAQLGPVNLGAAATWQPELIEEAAAHTATELRARGVHLALVSGLDILRDPRWGRAEECFSEDPLLAALCVRAQVRGMRNQPGLGVVLKHFAGQGAAIGGRNGSGTPIGPRELAEIHLPAARAGVDEGALGVMAAYNDIDGVPCTANEHLLGTILRDEWGFPGIVMADMFAIDRLTRAALSPAEAAVVALRAGVDLSMCDISYTVLEEAVTSGVCPESLIDRACGRVLALKIRLGLLDPPAARPSFPPPRPIPRDGLTLLRNHGELLPLPAVPGRVAVLGPNAADVDCLLGDYVPPLPAGAGTTVLDAVREMIPDVVYERGCELTTAIPGGRDRAVVAATGADLVVLVLGSTGRRDYDDEFQANGAAGPGGAPRATTGEGFDAAEIELPAAQRDLVDAVAGTGTPVVAVVVSGRPLGVGHAAARCAALLYAWYPGPDGARAIASVILGGTEPTGRLPVSLPPRSAVLPVAYNERLETTTRYVDGAGAADFVFGAGLGFTRWDLGPATVAGHTVTATLRNTGVRRGTQVVQLYGRASVPGLLPRRAMLLGFTRCTLAPGEARPVTVRIAPDALAAVSGTLVLWLSITGSADGPP